MSVVFASFVGLSPAIYGLLRMPSAQHGSAAQTPGYVGFFCVAAVFTLWGAIGQVATLFYAVAELRASQGFPPLLALLMLVLAGCLQVLLVIYGAVSVRKVILDAATPVQVPAGAAAQGMSGAPPPAPDSGWQLL